MSSRLTRAAPPGEIMIKALELLVSACPTLEWADENETIYLPHAWASVMMLTEHNSSSSVCLFVCMPFVCLFVLQLV